MGQDKALIAIEGVPLLRRVCEAALQCTPRVYVVTPWIERYQKVIPPTCHLIQEQLLPAETGPHGPLVGFAQALAHIETDWVLLLACDLPCLQSEVLQRWASELEGSGDAIALLPRTKKGWDALCGFYQTKCLASLMAAIERGERSFQGWLAQETVKEIGVSDPSMLFNCNTVEDLVVLTGSEKWKVRYGE